MNLKRFNTVIETAAKTPSKKEKEDIIRAALNAYPELGKLFELALSPYVTFGIAKLSAMNGNAAPANDAGTANAIDVLHKLARRELTGNAAREQVEIARSFLAPDEREAFDRILLKDLRAGFSESTVNKAKAGTVPVFACQLALSEMPKLEELSYPILAEPKYDGVRTIAIKDGKVQLFSRNGKPFENFAEIEAVLNDSMPDKTVFDGEVLSPVGFQALMTRAKAKPGVATNIPTYYQVFDGMRLDQWMARSCNAVLAQRRAWVMTKVLDMACDPRVRATPGRVCNSIEEVEAFYREQLALGLEGLMLKPLGGHYTFKRNKSWLKLKPFDTLDLEVIDIRPGNGKYEGQVGALVCRGDVDGSPVLTEVGSGFTDDERAELGRDTIGQIIEVRYQEVTQAVGCDTLSLRFPTFVRFRGVEKL